MLDESIVKEVFQTADDKNAMASKIHGRLFKGVSRSVGGSWLLG